MRTVQGKIRGNQIECVKRKRQNEFIGIRKRERGKKEIEEWTDAVRSKCNDQLEMFQLCFFF